MRVVSGFKLLHVSEAENMSDSYYHVFFLDIVHKNQVKSVGTNSTKFKGLEFQAKVLCSKSI